MRSPLFAWTAETADDWRNPWPGFTSTRYEAKAKQAGRVPCYLMFRRVGSVGGDPADQNIDHPLPRHPCVSAILRYIPTVLYWTSHNGRM